MVMADPRDAPRAMPEDANGGESRNSRGRIPNVAVRPQQSESFEDRLAACRALAVSTAKKIKSVHFTRNFVKYVQYSPQIREKMPSFSQFSRFDPKVRQTASLINSSCSCYEHSFRFI